MVRQKRIDKLVAQRVWKKILDTDLVQHERRFDENDVEFYGQQHGNNVLSDPEGPATKTNPSDSEGNLALGTGIAITFTPSGIAGKQSVHARIIPPRRLFLGVKRAISMPQHVQKLIIKFIQMFAQLSFWQQRVLTQEQLQQHPRYGLSLHLC